MFCLAPPGFSHAEIAWRMFANLLHPLAAQFRTVWVDPRGTGLSDRDAIDYSIEAMNRDLEAVVESDRGGPVRAERMDRHRAICHCLRRQSPGPGITSYSL